MLRFVLIAAGLVALAQSAAAQVKDQSRLPDEVAQSQPSTETPSPLPVPAPTPAPAPGTTTEQPPAADQAAPPGAAPAEPTPDAAPDESAAPDDTAPPDELSLGEIPVIETMELTLDIARRAIDSYTMVKTKYENSDLESYENLQDFVDQNPDGKNFEADIKAAGFANVNDWNTAITTLGFAYTGVTDDQSADIKQQVAEIEADTELAQDMKDRMVASLKAMIPSENNKKVVEDLMKEPGYTDKLKQLGIEEE